MNRRRLLGGVCATSLFAAALVPTAAFGETGGVTIAPEHLANSAEMGIDIRLVNTPDDGTWDAGDVAEFRITFTNKTDITRGIALVESNLEQATDCKSMNAAPDTPVECYVDNHPKGLKLTHTITEADVKAGTFQPYATFVMYETPGYSGAPFMETSAGVVPYAEDVSTALEITNPKSEGAAWHVGERMNFKLTLTNKTEKARSFESTSSNLTNWQACKWTSVAPNAPHECTSAYHDVTEEDLARGFFTPYISWKMYESPGYSGSTVKVPAAYGPVVQIATNHLQITSFAPADNTAPELKAGDTLTFNITLKNTGAKPMTIKDTGKSTVALGAECAGPIEANGSLSCTATRTLTENEVCTGKATATIDLVGLADNLPAGDGKQSAQAELKASCPAASGAKAPDADPTLDISDLQVVPLRNNGSGYNIRIPAIAVAPNGDLLASYDYRPTNGRAKGGDSPNENSIRQRRSTDNGATWEEETVIAQGVVDKDNPKGYSDPSYVVDRETGTIFNFHVYSQVSGVFANNPGYHLVDGEIDETNPHTMNLAVSVSKDNGYSWQTRVVTNQVLTPLLADHPILSCFATSGAGTQKMTEPHKGRLLQQVACVVDQNGNNVPENNHDNVVAFTMYSDDHGETWHGGKPTALRTDAGQTIRFDENKVVELSDGTLLLNSRTTNSAGSGHRLVALSKDGGETWGDYRIDTAVNDPANNAQVIRAFPNAKPGTLRSKVVLFSNTNSKTDRVNGTLWVSYDDGATWDTHRTFRAGGTGYTTMAIQSDGSIGILFEPNIWNNIAYLKTSLAWVDPELKSELKAREVEPQTVADREQITPIPLASLFDRNDPLLKDMVKVTGLPEGLAYNEESGAIEGTPSVGNTDAQDFNVSVTLTEEEDGTGRPRTATAAFQLTVAPHVDIEVTPGQPQNVNPSAADPADCATKPYVTVSDAVGVVYTARIADRVITPEENGTFVYDYGQSITVNAEPAAGYVFAQGAQTTWNYSSELASACAIPDPDPNPGEMGGGVVSESAPPSSPLARTGASIWEGLVLALVIASLGGVMLSIRRTAEAD